MKKQNQLLAPIQYWNLINTNAPIYTNTCGGSGITTSLVPETLFGLRISEFCAIHDFMYEQGKDKKQADSIFLENMLSTIKHHKGSFILKGLRKAKAYVYYLAVKLFGNSFFNKK